MSYRRGLAVLAVGTTTLALAGGCWGGYSSAEEQLSAIGAEIDELSADRSSTSDSECGVVAIGSKPCGGPTSYIIYSRATVDEELLLAKVEQYTELDRLINNLRHYGSDCLYVEVPSGAISVEGMCVADWRTTPVVRDTELVYVMGGGDTYFTQTVRVTPDSLVFDSSSYAPERFLRTLSADLDIQLNTALADWDTLPEVSAEPICCDVFEHWITYRGRTLAWSDGQAQVPGQLLQIAAAVVYFEQFPD